MKKILFLLVLVVTCLSGFSQSPIESVKESDKSKSELYSAIRMFISDKWVNPKKAITNEDKELGLIQINTTKEIEVGVGMGMKCVYTYKYNTKFRVKDNKYKIEIYDIVCTDARQVGMGGSDEVPMIPYFEGDNAPDKLKTLGRGISKKKAIQMMDELRSEFDSIINGFESYLNSFNDDF